MSELRLPPNAGHLRGNEVVATILDLVTPAAQCAQVLTPIVDKPARQVDGQADLFDHLEETL